MEIKTTDCRFHVEVEGPVEAPWLVLSHSLGSNLEMWSPQATAFGRRFRLLRYDTRGHGRSSAPGGPYTIDQLGGDVLRLLDAVGSARASFCGLSMGGATGLWLATHAAGRFDRFVVCDTVPWLGPPASMLERAAAVRRDGLEALADPTMARWFTPELRASDPQTVARIRAAFLATPREGYAACCEALAHYDVRDRIASIEKPVLVVAGTHDPSPPIAAAREYASRIPGAEFVELPAAHLSNLGAAGQFNAAVERFLGKENSDQ